MNLSPHFTLTEATVSDTAARLGINNQPDSKQLENMIYAAERLEILREYLGVYIHVTSWLRVPALNLVIPGSSSTSAHMDGFAIDCSTGSMSPLQLCKEAAALYKTKKIKFDQIIHEYGNWMHISFAKREREQLLTIFKNDQGKKYLPGLLTREQYLIYR